MRGSRRFQVVSLAIMLLAGREASAQITGTIDPSDPLMPIMAINEPNCGAPLGMTARYATHNDVPSASGNFIISLTSSFNSGAFYVYRAPFNPNNVTVNCIGAANLGHPKRIVLPLSAGVTYTVVVFNNTGYNVSVNYDLAIIGPLKKPVDFTNDGVSDLVVVRDAGGPVSWWIADTTSSSVSQITWGVGSDVFLAADYALDGIADAVIWRPGPLGTAGFWIRNSIGGGIVHFKAFGQTGDDPRVIGDYDEYTAADLAIYRAGAAPGQPSFWYYSAVNGPPSATMWGQHGDTPVPGDFDSDQRNDFVVRRDAGGGSAVFLMRLTTGGVTGGFAAIFFGTPSDLVAPGDYDGDARTDLAIIRNVGGALQWWIRRSSDGAIVSQIFGVMTDLPVPGDYDGDGKTDIAVWRPGSTGMFWVSKSSGGLLTRAWGTTGDYPVANWNIH